MVHGFRDDEQPEVLAHFGENLKSQLAQPLECVGRSTWLERSATEEPRSGFSNPLGCFECLLTRLDAARPGDHRDFFAAESGVRIGEANHRVLFLQFAADQLVGLADADDFLHAIERLNRAGLYFAAVSRNADGGALGPGNGVRAQPQALNFLANGLHVGLRRVGLQYD